MYHNLSYKEKLKNGWRIQIGSSFTTNKDDIGQTLQDANNNNTTVATPTYFLFKKFNVATNQIYNQTRLVLEKKLPGISMLRFGVENSYSNEKNKFTTYNGQQFFDTVKQNIIAPFVETDIYATNNLAVKAGTRAEYSSLLAKWNIAPRLAFAYKLNKLSQVSIAYGQFYQNPDRRILPTVYNVGFSKATHYILNYQKVTNVSTLRAEVFYKKYDALYKTAANSFGQTVAANTNGNGFAKGFELFWRDKKTFKNIDYWVSYSFLDTKRDFNNYPSLLEPTFASKHNASLVVKKFVVKWKTGFNASYSFATGRPYYNIVYNNISLKNEIADQGKTINYNNLSFSLNYLPYLGKVNAKKFMVLVLSVSNVLGQNQVFTYNYSANGLRKEPVGPTSKRFVFIGAFINFGVDRTENVINGNL
jgi:hypothetical protein